MQRPVRIILLVAVGTFLFQGELLLSLKQPESSLAESLARKIELLRERYERESSDAMELEVSEDEANAYLAHRLADQFPEGVVDPWVRFVGGPVWAGAMLDLAVLRSQLPQSSIMQLLAGRVPVELSARLRAEGGVGKLDLESVTLGGIPLPKTFLQELVSTYTKSASRPDGVRLEEPFNLPLGLESVRTEKGKLLLRQREMSEPSRAARPSPGVSLQRFGRSSPSSVSEVLQ